MRHVLVLLLALGTASLGCHADEPSPELSTEGSLESATSGAEEPADAAEGPACPRDAEGFGAALVAFLSQDVPAPSAEDPSTPVEWTPEWRAWNELQSARLRLPEGETVPGAVMRHRLWLHALRVHRAALESGAFTIDQERETEAGVLASFRAGTGDDALTVQVLRESGCWRLDDR